MSRATGCALRRRNWQRITRGLEAARDNDRQAPTKALRDAGLFAAKHLSPSRCDRRSIAFRGRRTRGVLPKNEEDRSMAKGQMRGNKEAKKPKKEKPKTIAAAPPTVKIGTTDKKK